MNSESVANDNSNSAAERRKQVFLGDLDPHFLRITPVGVRSQQVQRTSSQAGRVVSWPQYAAHHNQFLSMPSNAVGRLLLSVNQAKLAKNYGLTRMDPYCRIIIAHHVFETHTSVNGSKNPRWNKNFSVFLPSGVDSFTLEIYNEMTFSVDDRIAWGLIQLPAKIFEGQTVDDWFPLSGRQGDEREGIVNLVLTLEDLPSVPSNPQMMPHPPVPAPYVPKPISDEDICSLQEMFPDTDTEVIKSILESQRGNKEAAISALLQMQST